MTGQVVTPEEDLDYVIEDFILPGGRLGNNVNAIVEGPYGFLWFGSHGGLHRYDGNEFITYRNEPDDTIAPTYSLTFPYVENLYWDKEDILWVTTYGGGMYRFDPRTETFKHYQHDPNDSSSISHQRVMCAGEDAKGDLWFGTLRGLNKFDRLTEQFTRYYPFDPDQESPHNDIRNLYLDKAGTFWIAAGESFFNPRTGGLARLDPDESFTLFTHDDSQGAIVDPVATRAIWDDRYGTFWIGNSFGLEKLDRSTGTFEKMHFADDQPHAPGAGLRLSPPVFSILEDKQDGLWVGTIGDPSYPSHLLRYDYESQKIQHFPIQTSVWHLCESSDGTIWTAGASVSGRVLKISSRPQSYDLQGGNFYRTAFNQSPLGKQLKKGQGDRLASGAGPSNIAIDNSGTIWGTHVFVEAIGLAQFQPHAILSRYHPSQERVDFFHLAELNMSRTAPPTFNVGSMAVSRDGKIWGSYATDSTGIFSFDPETKEVEQFLHDPNDTNSLSSNYVVDLLMDRQGELWVATFESGLNRIEPRTKKITRYNFSYPTMRQNNFPIALEEDPQGKIWIGGELWHHDTALLFKIDPVDNTIEKIPLFTPRNSSIRSLAFSPEGKWMAFTLWENGFGTMDLETRSVYYFNNQTGFPLDQTTSVLSDDNGHFWVGDRDQGTFARIAYNGQQYIFQNQNLIGSWHRRAEKGPDGHLYFLNNEGWAEIDPDIINPDRIQDSSRIQLVDLYVLGEKQIPNRHQTLDQPIWMCDQVQLPHDAETFAFRFTDFDFQSTESAFQYRLHPYESIWRRTDNEPIANYYKIPQGTYDFQVRSIKRTRNLRNQELSLQIVILPPWWRTGWAYVAYAILILSGIWLVHRFQKARTIRKERERTRDKELAQAKEIEKAYAKLKATQDQLIHAEKMASLGELTAGIAHEIQNPLNFVNNFSEVNSELLDEMGEELASGNLNAVRSLAADIAANAGKIVHHGKRADAIVKSMLQHSRSGPSEKVATDMNKLLDEYLRLAYHGMRAKDKQFNVKLDTTFDQNLPLVPINVQEMGRVILNLITNAFYALNERTNGSLDNYQPQLWISSKIQQQNIEIQIKDNGNGIPEEIRDKIFQPFFTTKASGQGTGLGLSLSYDIIKAHQGDLTVDSAIGEGTTFNIRLPLKSKDT